MKLLCARCLCLCSNHLFSLNFKTQCSLLIEPSSEGLHFLFSNTIAVRHHNLNNQYCRMLCMHDLPRTFQTTFRPASAFKCLSVRFTILSVLPLPYSTTLYRRPAISLSCTSSVKWTRSGQEVLPPKRLRHFPIKRLLPNSYK